MHITVAGSAIAYTPNDNELSAISVELAAFDGDVGISAWPVPDPSAAVSVLDGRRFLIKEIDTVLSDGFIIDQDRDRGSLPASTARIHTFSVEDANALLEGFRVLRVRPSETDYARVMAMFALDSGDWGTVDTTWVLNSSTVTMPKKRYASDGGWTGELIPDLVEYTGKTLFIHDKATSGRCLHYHVLTTGHTCGLTITDVIADILAAPTTKFAPGNPHRSRTSVDLKNSVRGYDQQGRTALSEDATSITDHDPDGRKHEAYIAFDSTSQSDLNVKTAAYLASNKAERDTWTCTIGPLDATALSKIRAGDLITVTSSVMGLTASTQRIAHVTARVFQGKQGVLSPGLWDLDLELGAPVRRRRRVKKVQAPPEVPGVGDDSPGGSVTCDFDFSVALGGFSVITLEGDGTITGSGAGMAVRVPQVGGVDVLAVLDYPFLPGRVEVLASVTIPGPSPSAVSLGIGFYDVAHEPTPGGRGLGPKAAVTPLDSPADYVGGVASVESSAGSPAELAGIDWSDTIWVRVSYASGTIIATYWPAAGDEEADGQGFADVGSVYGPMSGIYIEGHALNNTETDVTFTVNSLEVTSGCASFPAGFAGAPYGPIVIGMGDASEVDFTLPTDFGEGTLAVSVDGVFLEPDRYSGDHSTNVVTLALAPPDGSTIVAMYRMPL